MFMIDVDGRTVRCEEPEEVIALVNRLPGPPAAPGAAASEGGAGGAAANGLPSSEAKRRGSASRGGSGRAAEKDSLRNHAAELIKKRGALSSDDLIDLLAARGKALSKAALARLLNESPRFEGDKHAWSLAEAYR